ncbi:glycogen/starch synthase [Flavobacterium sp. NG2]|uniref:glycogen synthase n=1 Tax=Flavobacterium sp. NG2 TaxID=3097547 RepID=UPI002A816A5E|nr:glycogen/starch synthase [Flavobacterium sp. NG2]WPR70759.1 glycogen/starch synthase [Flavobacterium sp. NG2]
MKVLEIIHISAECYPVAKVGGLADVVGAIAKYQFNAGHNVSVVVPCYETKFIKENEFETIHWSQVKLGHFNFPFSVLKGINHNLGFNLYLITIPELFDRGEIYGYKDDIERFLSFQIATLDWFVAHNLLPDVVHCHDHHSAVIPFMMQQAFDYEKLRPVPTVLTVHNALYQGQFGFDKLHYFPSYDLSKTPLLEWSGCINSLAVGLKCARAITTVSPNYLNEINYNGYGLEMLFNQVRYKSRGILNGIDNDVWNPKIDPLIATNYDVDDFEVGKQKNKEKLCKLFNFNVEYPLISFVGRLYEEKGADLLSEVARKAISTNNNKINILILGSGNKVIEDSLKLVLNDFSSNYNLSIEFNEKLAHQIYAGSDFILMPSRMESCGLNQMYAYRYGAIPVVRRTGGLKDTVVDISENGFGICHDHATVDDVCDAIQRACELYKEKEKIKVIAKSGMVLNHSWEKAYQEYLEMYNLIIK